MPLTPDQSWALHFGEALQQYRGLDSGNHVASHEPDPEISLDVTNEIDVDLETNVFVAQETDVAIEIGDGSAAVFSDFLNGDAATVVDAGNAAIDLGAPPLAGAPVPAVPGAGNVTINTSTDIDVETNIISIQSTEIDISVGDNSFLGLNGVLNGSSATVIDAGGAEFG